MHLVTLRPPLWLSQLCVARVPPHYARGAWPNAPASRNHFFFQLPPLAVGRVWKSESGTASAALMKEVSLHPPSECRCELPLARKLPGARKKPRRTRFLKRVVVVPPVERETRVRAVRKRGKAKAAAKPLFFNFSLPLERARRSTKTMRFRSAAFKTRAYMARAKPDRQQAKDCALAV